MFCLNCRSRISKGKFCSKKCSNLYNAKSRSLVFKIVKTDDSPLSREDLSKLWHIKNSHQQLLKYGFVKQSAIVKEFNTHHKLCPFCKELYYVETRKNQNGCPKPICNAKYKVSQKQQAKETYINFMSANDGYHPFKLQDRRIAREAFKEKHGVSTPFALDWVKRKSKDTKLERYGDENFTNLPKMKATKLEKYGDENYNNAVKAKRTKLEKYGDENYNNVAKNRATSFERYGVEYPTQLPEIQEKISRTNFEKRGTKTHNQSHITNYGDYESPDVWKNFKSVQEACDYFNVGYNAVLRHLHKYNPEIVKNRSITQNLIFEAIPVENKFQNTKNIIPPNELDIYLPDYKLAIEYNGLLYHSQGISKHSMLNTPDYPKDYHLQKTLGCNSLGIQLLHIFEGEDIDLWLSMINSKLGLNERIYARNCYAVELRNSDLREFLDANHLQGYCNASIAIGLYTKTSTKVEDIETSKLVAVMTFSKPRFSKGYDYELVRFCSLKGYSITGGASKLWKFFLRKYAPKSVISYANLRFSNGELYENLGFSLKHRSEPNYYYFKDDIVLHSRNKFQKHKLKDLLENFDADKSEVENMFANGYRRIYDCGNLVYEWIAN